MEAGGAGVEKVKVVVRVRPLLKPSSAAKRKSSKKAETTVATEVVVADGEENVLQQQDSKKVIRVKLQPTSHKYKVFDDCDCAVGPTDDQADVFAKSGVKELLDQAIQGYRCLSFVYGMTGAGKTYTMVGGKGLIKSGNDAGLLPRAIEHLFFSFENKPSHSFEVKVSCFEIYKESIIDMLAAGSPCGVDTHSHLKKGASNLPVRESKKHGFFVEGLCTEPCPDKEDLLQKLEAALRHRRVGSHHLNDRSNRSHLVLTLHLESKTKDNIYATPPTYGSMTFVDLAGSERLKETGSIGKMLKEAGHINKSLYVLGKVIRGMNGSQPVPFRDNKLTKLLYSSLGGNCKTIMIACVSPAMSAAKETVRTLNFAVGVKGISNHPSIVLDPQDQVIKRLQDEIRKLRLENAQLRESLIYSPCSSKQFLEEGFELDNPTTPTTDRREMEFARSPPPAKHDKIEHHSSKSSKLSVAGNLASSTRTTKRGGGFFNRIFVLRGAKSQTRATVPSSSSSSSSSAAAAAVPNLRPSPSSTKHNNRESTLITPAQVESQETEALKPENVADREAELEQKLLRSLELLNASYDKGDDGKAARPQSVPLGPGRSDESSTEKEQDIDEHYDDASFTLEEVKEEPLPSIASYSVEPRGGRRTLKNQSPSLQSPSIDHATPPTGGRLHRRQRPQPSPCRSSSLKQSPSSLRASNHTPIRLRAERPERDNLLSSTWSPPSTMSSLSAKDPNNPTYHEHANRILEMSIPPYQRMTNSLNQKLDKQQHKLQRKAGLVEKEVQRCKGNNANLHLHPHSIMNKGGPLSPREKDSIRKLISTWTSQVHLGQKILDRNDFIF